MNAVFNRCMIIAMVLALLGGIVLYGQAAKAAEAAERYRIVPHEVEFDGSISEYLPLTDGYILAGGRPGSGSQGTALIVKLDHDGNELWHRVYLRDGDQLALAVIPTRDGGYLAMGGGNNSGPESLLKIAADGTRQWDKELPAIGNLLAGQQLEDGRYMVAGSGMLYEVRVGLPTGLAADDVQNMITGMDPTMEYSVDDGSSYTQYDPDNEPEFAGDVDVWVRYRQDWSAGHEAGEHESFSFMANPIEAVGVLADISVAYGTVLADVGLPETVEVTLTGGRKAPAAVTWDGGNPAYDPTEPGEYTFTGTITPPSVATNPDGFEATVKVIVRAQPIVIEAVGVLADISVAYGTEMSDVGLPDEVTVTFNN